MKKYIAALVIGFTINSLGSEIVINDAAKVAIDPSQDAAIQTYFDAHPEIAGTTFEERMASWIQSMMDSVLVRAAQQTAFDEIRQQQIAAMQAVTSIIPADTVKDNKGQTIKIAK